MRLDTAWSATREVFEEFFGDEPFQKAAAISYFTLLSLAPLLLLVIAVAGTFFGEAAVQRQIVHEIEGLVGQRGAETIRTVIENASGPGRGPISLIVGLVTLFIGTTTVFVQLQTALNQIWGVKPRKDRGFLAKLILSRLASLAMVFGIGFILLVSLVVSAGLSAVSTHFDGVIANPHVWQAVNQGVSLLVITLLIAMIFKYLPDARVAWRHVWLGAAVTSVLFSVGKYAIGLYLGQASIGSSYGAAGSVIVLMVWIYYAAMIAFFGAEITQVTARRTGSGIRPSHFAEREA